MDNKLKWKQTLKGVPHDRFLGKLIHKILYRFVLTMNNQKKVIDKEQFVKRILLLHFA